MSNSTIDRSRLPIRRPPFQGVVNDTLDGSQPDWEHVAPIRAPDGAPNVLLVLTDDAGFGNPSAFGGPIRTPTLERLAGGGLSYNRFHTTALCSPTRAALMTGPQPPCRRLRHGRRVRRAVPRLHGDAAEDLPAVREDAAGQRVLDRVLRQVAPDARQPAGPGRPVRPLAERARLRLLLGLPGRRVRPVRPDADREQQGDRRAGGGGLLPPRRDGREDDRVDPRRARARLEQAVVRLLLDRRQPRAAPGRSRVGGQVQGRLRPGLGQAARGDLRAPEADGRDPGRRGADAAARRDARLGLARARPSSGLRAPDGGLRGLLRERGLEHRARRRRDRGDGRARQHARHLHLGRQRRQPRGLAHGHVQRGRDDERRPADRGAAAPARAQVGRARRVGHRHDGAALLRGLGVGRQLPVPVGQAGRLAPRRHARPDGRALAERRSGSRAPCAPSSRT